MGICQELFFYKLENSGPTHPKKIYFFLIFLFDNYLYSVNLWDMYNSNRKDIMDTKQLKRIADAIEEILRLVKKDMEPKKK